MQAAKNLTLLTVLHIPVLSFAIPNGDFVYTCSDISYEKEAWYKHRAGELLLSATCEDNSGGKVQTSLNYDTECDGGLVSNLNGRLVCEVPAIPPTNIEKRTSIFYYSSYSETCFNETFDKKSRILSATCYDSSHVMTRNSQLDFNNCAPYTTVSNKNGSLVCDTPMPNGTYKDSCKTLRYNPDTGILIGRCSWKYTELDYRKCQQNSTVSDKDGHLVCDPSGQAPNGSYTISCSNIMFNPETKNLTATCSGANGRSQIDSRLNYGTCQVNSTVSNNDGNLACDN